MYSNGNGINVQRFDQFWKKCYIKPDIIYLFITPSKKTYGSIYSDTASIDRVTSKVSEWRCACTSWSLQDGLAFESPETFPRVTRNHWTVQWFIQADQKTSLLLLLINVHVTLSIIIQVMKNTYHKDDQDVTFAMMPAQFKIHENVHLFYKLTELLHYKTNN